MAVTSYPTPLNATNTDIDLVGGKDAYIGMHREDRLGNRYVLHKVGVGGSVIDGTWVAAWRDDVGVYYPLFATAPIVGANTTGKTITAGQYFWCMVYGTYDMVVSVSADAAYKRLKNSGGAGEDTGADSLGPVESCGMSLEARSARISGKARCLIDPRSGY